MWVNDWPNYKMASPSDLWPAFWRFKELFLSYGWDTLWRTVVGLLIAIVVGVFLGMIMGFSKIMREGLYPLLVGFNAIPKATVVPIVALMFVGQHDLNTILIAFMISFFPIAVSVSIGLSTLEPEYRDILRSLGASKLTIFWKIALPKTLPEFFGALPEIDINAPKVGIFGKLTKLDATLNPGDRIEIYRPLIADPKEARKKRAAEGKTMKKGAKALNEESDS